ncbi:MAG TPA: DUF4097 family beta strand repeat-containing protein [Rhodanobacteraceae bacterium]|nr:DUF4097 family beta strand repeat-containing protein [Rhodanobacteraceae bacterium]
MHRMLPALLALALLAGCASQQATRPAHSVSKTLKASRAAPPGSSVAVENLLGHVRLSQGGPQFAVTATVVAGGDSEAAARALADSVSLALSGGNGAPLALRVNYPTNDHDSFRYVPASDDAQANPHVHVLGLDISGGSSNSSVTWQGKTVHIYRGQDRGVPLHVDLAISLPAGVHATVTNHVGPMEAHDLHAALTLHSSSGDLALSGVTGDIETRSASGDVTVSDQHGATSVHTASGDIKASRIDGDVRLHTGSGDIDGQVLHGQQLDIETGSGDIDVRGVSGALDFSTGSGDVTVADPGNVPSASLGTGSGDVVLHGDLSKLGSFDITTGSGDVTIATARPPALHLEIDSGDISVQWLNLSNVQTGQRHYSADVAGGSGQGRIHTGNGNVVLKKR